ncbi:HNH endonuclease [Variovorax ginsengisoli]|uniref:HNH endonuclease n=1 Tax=Variovorax ginsengisoli TaxID=363844 RepID=A0ABT8SDY0_9BURK|nr:HNH endonuclease [Variovorax ginsengisoli]MDN8617820.1 HNH endonuclease [Variovorax ginsengisoli]MDO1536990.1 HNH endonuclease [Variovorax ginsengisoli]
MIKAPSLQRLRELFHYDPATGVFTRLHASGNRRPGPVTAKPDAHGYTYLHFDGVTYRQHRLAYFYVTGEWPNGPIDHINAARGVNAMSEIRAVTNAMNNQNRRKANRNNSTGVLGVSKKVWKGRVVGFAARICIDSKLKNLGTFRTKAEAHAVYVAAKREYHPGNTL